MKMRKNVRGSEKRKQELRGLNGETVTMNRHVSTERNTLKFQTHLLQIKQKGGNICCCSEPCNAPFMASRQFTM